MTSDDFTVEDFENMYSMPSFEEELEASDVTKKEPRTEKIAFIGTCPKCGVQFMVGPDAIATCPKASQHDPEDDAEITSDKDRFFTPSREMDYLFERS